MAPSRPMHARHVVCLAVVAFACTAPEKDPPPPIPPPAKVDQEIVDLAFQDCFGGDCDRAHAHLAEVAPASPARRSASFRAVQYRYDADRMLRADIDPDLNGRRTAYESIAASVDTDPILRLLANERIARLGAKSLGAEVVMNARPGAVAPEAVAVDALLKQSRSKDPADQQHVRTILEPKVFAGKATAEDLMMLKMVCKAEGDVACLHRLDRLITR